MRVPGELVDGRVLVRVPAEASRIHNKGHYGRPMSGGGLQLDLREAAYLLELERLTVERKGEALPWSTLVVEAAREHPEFEIHYLVYRDLRERGYLVHAADATGTKAGAQFSMWPRGTERPGVPEAWVRAVSERSPFRWGELAAFVAAARAAGVAARIAVVDEESDLTFYQLDADAPGGSHRLQEIAETDADLLAGRILVADPARSKELHAREFFGRPVASGLQLSLVEGAHLLERGVLRLHEGANRRAVTANVLRKRAREAEPLFDLRTRCYADLKRRGLIVKTGFKFGTHFRAYEAQPDEAHAPFLVQAVEQGFESAWEPLARAIRLGHSVKKKFYLAAVGPKAVDYLGFGRYRP